MDIKVPVIGGGTDHVTKADLDNLMNKFIVPGIRGLGVVVEELQKAVEELREKSRTINVNVSGLPWPIVSSFATPPPAPFVDPMVGGGNKC